ncbi:MAG: hypothetical protein KDE26_32305, partial [Bacteroidetes bacterium]|nr:hypothetical protein [Bacteroidota bacterium]
KKRGKLTFSYRWEADEPNFNLPIHISIRDDWEQIIPTGSWKSIVKKGIKENQIRIESDGLFTVERD